jgi:hypothetical protein
MDLQRQPIKMANSGKAIVPLADNKDGKCHIQSQLIINALVFQKRIKI